MDASTTVTLGCLSFIIILWFMWRKRRMSVLERLGIPGPKPHFIMGNITQTSAHTDIGVDWAEKYGKIFGIYLGAWPFIVVSDTELLKLVQVKEFKTFPNRAQFIADLAVAHPLSHDAIFGQTDEKWKNARNVMTPAFTTVKLKKMMPIAAATIDIFLNKIAATNKKTFDIAPLFRQMAFDITSKTSFGISTDVQNDEKSQFIRSVYRSFDAGAKDILASLIVCFPELGPLPQILRIIKDGIRHKLNLPSAATVVENCKKIVKMRKENPQSARPDLLQGMIDASELSRNSNERDSEKKGAVSQKPLTDNEVVANAFGFMLAGFDAISTIMGFCTLHLVEHPEVQEKVREEIKQKVKGKVEYDDLVNLTYIDQVLSETLRLFPFNIIGTNRVAAEDFKYKDITIPRGMSIGVNTSAMNMDPNYWSEPKTFKPERFSPENEGNINTVAYQPFGLGPRNCIGLRFAQVIMKTVIASLFQSYKLEKPADAKPYEMEYTIFSVRPKYGIEVRAVPTI